MSTLNNNWNFDKQLKRICCIGAGYVGGPSMAVIAYRCPNVQVFVVDSNHDKISQWNSDSAPMFEPKLDSIVQECRDVRKNLIFTTDIENQIHLADLIFIAVDTPTKKTGYGKGRAADISNLEKVTRLIATHSKSNKIVVEKSTVPVKAAETIKSILSASNKQLKFEVLSNPEFMAEGTAIDDLTNPDRVIIGGDMTTESGKYAIKLLEDLYCNWVDESKILTTDTWSSELSKLAANAFLAQRLSSINAIASICESTGADIDEVAKAIGLDSRIGTRYLKAGIGFGGSCFQKDVLNLVYLSECLNLPEVADYWIKVIEMNDYQRTRAVKKILRCLHNTVKGKSLAIFGFSFKADTSDTRESSAKYICQKLIEEGAIVKIYDPEADWNKITADLNILGSSDVSKNKDLGQWKIVSDPYDCVENSHAIIICTDWHEFTTYDYKRIHESMAKPAFIFDGRRVLDRYKMIEIGFNIEMVGSGSSPNNYNWI